MKKDKCPYCGRRLTDQKRLRHPTCCPQRTNRGKFRAWVMRGGLPGLGKR